MLYVLTSQIGVIIGYFGTYYLSVVKICNEDLFTEMPIFLKIKRKIFKEMQKFIKEKNKRDIYCKNLV